MIFFFKSSIFLFNFLFRLKNFLSINLASFFFIFLLDLKVFYQTTNNTIFILLTKLLFKNKSNYNDLVIKLGLITLFISLLTFLYYFIIAFFILNHHLLSYFFYNKNFYILYINYYKSSKIFKHKLMKTIYKSIFFQI